ncbi:lysophospholipid acyltransferase family protein [Altererythrobacter sp. GH1-8]|uniref:lysophospholipid acyltransferase family protein n=1 Tax=Altererythrobacter sp. GH1-8 TaxID=3349333 RepID=UPI00374D00E3
MPVLRSLAFYILFYLASALLVMAAVVAMSISKQAVRNVVERWSGWHRWCVTRLLGIEVRLEGKPEDGPVLYAMKHESFFEAIDAPTLLKRPSVFAKRELFDIPGWGRAALFYGLVPVAREEGATALRRMIVSARDKVEDGRPLVIFPEGTRVPHGTSPKLQAGFAGLYKMLRLPVVPVAVNSGPLYHRLWKRSGTITYKFGEPIPPGLPREEIEARVHKAINALARNPGVHHPDPVR